VPLVTKMTELSLHSLCIPYRVANVMSFLVEICIGRGRYVSRPSDLSLIKVLQKQSMTLQDHPQGACGHLAMPHLTLLSMRRLYSQET